jgi:hypothetical protein
MEAWDNWDNLDGVEWDWKRYGEGLKKALKWHREGMEMALKGRLNGYHFLFHSTSKKDLTKNIFILIAA